MLVYWRVSYNGLLQDHLILFATEVMICLDPRGIFSFVKCHTEEDDIRLRALLILSETFIMTLSCKAEMHTAFQCIPKVTSLQRHICDQ